MSGAFSLGDVVRRFIESSYPDASSQDWTVALSGGVDSMVLTRLLKPIADEWGVSLSAVHVNHGMRAEAARDAQFAEKACNELGIPLSLKTISLHDVPPELHKSVEADARRLRYQAIVECVLGVQNVPGSSGVPRGKADSNPSGGQVMGDSVENNKVHKPVVFLAHHADDQVETVLLRLLRGTSVEGLRGMQPVREWQGIRWMRPLLTVSKSQLVDYASSNGIDCIQDETNFDTHFTRNYIRHEVIPKLHHVQPNLAEVIGRLTDVLEAEDRWLAEVSQEHFRTLVQKRGKDLVIHTERLLSIPLPLQRRVVKIILYCLASADWTFDHVDSILRLCRESGASALVHLPGRVRVRKSYNELHFLRVDSRKSDIGSVTGAGQLKWRLDEQSMCRLQWSGSEQSWTFRCDRWNGREALGLLLADRYQALFPKGLEVTIRSYRAGERMKVLGLQGSKKVQDLFVDAKVPRHLRAEWPCFYVGDDLVWVPGVARSTLFLLDEFQDGWHVIAQSVPS
ncbi:tRNA lysidine(34) synthetase TilS [Alicyclobacillus ferrooxydans]|uniref:tRNA(Ile)-lysidine synthase n=1 Tax=Alicyclobacillus ferrooxydans TaxID=471514 RepID=A0A0P9CCT7_9BACL|nr:tRNA lysidine(34) synthetase TilS [Alicyclobacillus ferrooxydans]KPV43457.1 hypothetical protein AN477_12285 [Alicyclobacillus ferrooxydans]